MKKEYKDYLDKKIQKQKDFEKGKKRLELVLFFTFIYFGISHTITIAAILYNIKWLALLSLGLVSLMTSFCIIDCLESDKK